MIEATDDTLYANKKNKAQNLIFFNFFLFVTSADGQ